MAAAVSRPVSGTVRERLPLLAAMAAGPERRDRLVLIALACWAVALPTLIAYNVPPSATFLNQAASFVGWAALVAFLGLGVPAAGAAARDAGARRDIGPTAASADAGTTPKTRAYGNVNAQASPPALPFGSLARLRWPRLHGPDGLAALVAAFGVMVLCAAVSWAWRDLPSGLALSPIAAMAAAVLVLLAGAALGQQDQAVPVFEAFCWALVAGCALSSVVGLIQVFAPQLADGNWIAGAAFEGRASGNLRQPNHLSSLLLWGLIAVAWLREAGACRRGVAAAMAAVFLWVLVLSASRTGAVGVLLLFGWGLLDRQRPRAVRTALMLAPVAYAVVWAAMALWSHESHQTFGSEVRLTQDGDISSSRFKIWANTLWLIAHHPWAGVGFGNFNFAWSLTPFPNRPVAFFDHTHNLPLQFAVEMGIPVALLLLGLLGFALWRAWQAGRPGSDDALPTAAAGVRRAAFMVVLMMALHSQLEYPLWYAYFLLPTAFAFGLCLGRPRDAVGAARPSALAGGAHRTAPAWRSIGAAGVVAFVIGVASLADYWRVVVIFTSDDSRPLAARIEAGERSWFFDHHAHYAAVTTAEHPSDFMASFGIVTHYLLDTRLMTAWSRAYHERGDDQRARYLAQRLREFRNAESKPFFEPCDDPASATATLPFQCTPPTAKFDYRDFE